MSAPVFIMVDAGVRYWEDASVNGVEDTEGTLIPDRQGDRWTPLIELATGKIHGWPQGTTALVHYKVCDDGEYFLTDEKFALLSRWAGHYVPDRFLCHSKKGPGGGYGDYIIFGVGADGVIVGWKKPEIVPDEWPLFQPKGAK